MTGCRNNRYELDQVILWCAKNGVEIVTDESEADYSVINTCTVTHVADKKSRQLVRKTKHSNPDHKTIVFGCAARMQKAEFEKIMEVDVLLPDLPAVLEYLEQKSPYACRPDAGVRSTQTGFYINRARALVQIQDGCDNYCSYCIIAAARGKSKSRPADEIIDEINEHVKNGFNEVVLTGINIGAYGCATTTKPTESRLAELLQQILDETDIKRVRLSSMGPEYFYCSGRRSASTTITTTMIEILKNSRICRHIHLSVQSGSDSVLKRMRRNYTVEMMDQVILRLKKDKPGIAITTDIIVGFPGETDEEFQETMDFVKRHRLAKVHAFPYSKRANTLAATMEQVSDATKKARMKQLQSLASQCRKDFLCSNINQELPVLWESEVQPGVFEGLTDNYIRIRTAKKPVIRSITIEPVKRKNLVTD